MIASEQASYLTRQRDTRVFLDIVNWLELFLKLAGHYFGLVYMFLGYF